MIDAISPTVRLPILTSDLESGFVKEMDLISPNDPQLVELLCTPKKLACISVVSREMALDSQPEVMGVVGSSISRSLARSTDACAFAASTVDADPGVYSLIDNTDGPTGTACQQVLVMGAFEDLDPFIEAISKLEVHGAQLNHFFADARTVLALSKIRSFTGTAATSNVPLLSADASAPGQSDVSQPMVRNILGAPLHALPASAGVPVGDVVGIDSTRVYSVVREGVTLATSSDLLFDHDAIAIRATTRWSPAFPDPQSVVVIGSGGS